MRAFKAFFIAVLATAGATAAAAQQAPVTDRINGYDLLIPAERPAMLRAAGFVFEGDRVLNRCNLPVNFSATNPPSVIIRDVNGDGRTEALLRDTGSCYDPDGDFFAIIAKGPDGQWKLLLDGLGIVRMVAPGYQGWPDAEVQLAGACKPLYRWNGERYAAVMTCKK